MTLRLGIIAVALILLLSGLNVFLYKRGQEFKTQADENLSLANDRARQATEYRNKNGVLVSHNTVLTIQRDNARKLLSSEEFEWTTKFDGLKKNLKNLTQTTKLEIRIDTVLHIRKDTVDRPGMAQILLDDKYNYLAIDSTGSKIELRVEAPVQGVMYWERPHKFLFIRWGKKQYSSEFTCLNPLVHISNHEIIQVRRK